jgi:hypothetical protein
MICFKIIFCLKIYIFLFMILTHQNHKKNINLIFFNKKTYKTKLKASVKDPLKRENGSIHHLHHSSHGIQGGTARLINKLAPAYHIG